MLRIYTDRPRVQGEGRSNVDHDNTEVSSDAGGDDRWSDWAHDNLSINQNGGVSVVYARGDDDDHPSPHLGGAYHGV